MYDLSFGNIQFILAHFYKEMAQQDYYRKNYTLIGTQPTEPLVGYVRDNINEYIDMLFECTTDEEFADDEVAVVALLNNETLSLENKQRYLARCTTKITDISQVHLSVEGSEENAEDEMSKSKNELWNIILQEGCAVCTPENILWYFYENEVGLDEALIGFINSFAGPIIFKNQDFGEQGWDNSKLFSAVFNCEKLNDDIYISILRSLGRWMLSFSITTLQTEKVQLLIDSSLIRLQPPQKDNATDYTSAITTLTTIRTNYRGQCLSFILKNASVYMDMMRDLPDLIDINEMLSLSENSFEDNFCIELLDLHGQKISINNANPAIAVKNHILKKWWDASDAKSVFAKYDTEDSATQDILHAYAADNLASLAANGIPLSFVLLQRLAKAETPDVEALLLIISRQLQPISTADEDKHTKHELFLSPKELHSLLVLLQCTEHLKLFRFQQAKLDATETSNMFAKALEQAGWINKIDSGSEEQKIIIRGTKKIQVQEE